MRCKKTHCSFAAYDGVVDVFADCIAGKKISGRVTDSVSALLELYSNVITVRQIVVGMAREEHIEFHVFIQTFVAVERMELPPGVQFDSQSIDDDSRQHNNNYTDTGWHCDGQSPLYTGLKHNSVSEVCSKAFPCNLDGDAHETYSAFSR